MSDESRKREAMAKTAQTLREQAAKGGSPITHTQALERVQRAERKRKE